MRFCLLPRLVEATGCSAHHQPHVGFEIYRPSAQEPIFICHFYQTTSTSGSEVPPSNDRAIQRNRRALFTLLNGGIFNIKIAESEKRKRNLHHFSFFSYFYQMFTCNRIRNESRARSSPFCGSPQATLCIRDFFSGNETFSFFLM